MGFSPGNKHFTSASIFSNIVDAASGSFTESLTVSGVAVDITGGGGGGGGGLSNVVEDLTPELGGDLDGLSNDISGLSKLTVTGTQIIAPRGTSSLPGFAFDSQADTGMRHDGSTHLQFVVDTAVVEEMSSTIISPLKPINALSGSAAAPTIGFSGGTGLFRSAGPTLGFAVGTSQAMQMDSSSVVASVPLRGPSGSASAPSHAFGADSNTGMFLKVLAPDNAIYFSVQGNEILTVTGTNGEPKGIGVNGDVTADVGTFFDGLTVSGTPVNTAGTSGLVESAFVSVIDPEDRSYPLEQYAQFPYTIIESRHETSAGSLTASVKINDTVIEGLDNVTISGARESAAATSANAVSVGDQVTLVISGTTLATDLEFGLRLERI